MDTHSTNVKRLDFTLHLISICPIIYINRHLSLLKYGRAPAKEVTFRNSKPAYFS